MHTVGENLPDPSTPVLLRQLETDIVTRWQSRLRHHAGAALGELFGFVRRRWPWQRLRWSVTEYSQAAAIKDALARQGRPLSHLSQAPLGRGLIVRVCQGRTPVGCVHAEFLCDPLAVLQDRHTEIRAELLHTRKARLELALGLPCFHAFAGLLSEEHIDVPERTLLLNWRPASGSWEFHAGPNAELLAPLFHPQTDAEWARQVFDCLASYEPKLMRTARLCELTGLSRVQLDRVCSRIPGARIFEWQGVSLFEIEPPR